MKRNAVIIMSVLAFSVGFAQQKKTSSDKKIGERIFLVAKNDKMQHRKNKRISLCLLSDDVIFACAKITFPTYKTDKRIHLF